MLLQNSRMDALLLLVQQQLRKDLFATAAVYVFAATTSTQTIRNYAVGKRYRARDVDVAVTEAVQLSPTIA